MENLRNVACSVALVLILISFTHSSAVFLSLLVCLTSPVSAVRQTVLDVISLITSRSTEKTSAVILGNIVCESSQEIIADEAFIARYKNKVFSLVVIFYSLVTFCLTQTCDTVREG